MGTFSAENSGENVVTCPVAKPTVPMQLGPTRRTPPALARRTASSCSAAPSAPDSANPDDITTATGTPAAAQSSTASGTRAAATINSARSTGSPVASRAACTEAYAGSPSTVSALGFTGRMRPW